MSKTSYEKRPRKRRLTLLVVLVVYVFCILLVSVLLSAILLYLMYRLGLMQPISESRLPAALAFMLVISLFSAIIITSLAGHVSLRPLKKFIDATKEIAGGNFSVRVPEHGPEEYRRLVRSFNEMAQELGSIETLRDDFVSSISHEYKTPIVSIRGFARLLRRGNLPQAQQEQYLDVIIAEADRLAQLSSNVLLLSKLDAGGRPPQAEPYALDEQLRRVILLLDQQATKKQLNLQIDLQPCEIIANQELLQQVWVNLLHNAVKFTPENGHIAIGLESDAANACITIRDTGVGMSPETVARVFDKFYQGDISRSSEGNGLGLSLAQRIITLYGGTIVVQSEAGKGSVFRVTLPRSGAQ